ncbi:ATP-dependent DNA helicase RecG [bacterium]|nr:ATP-dependent DNA helicase RecG [bacterium]
MEIAERLSAIKDDLEDLYRKGFDPAGSKAFADSLPDRVGSFARHPLFENSGGHVGRFVEAARVFARSDPPVRSHAFWQVLNAFADLCRPVLQCDIQYLSGVGPARAEQFRKKNIQTVLDLLLTPPRDYHDRRALRLPSEAFVGQPLNFYARVIALKTFASRFRRRAPGSSRLELLVDCEPPPSQIEGNPVLGFPESGASGTGHPCPPDAVPESKSEVLQEDLWGHSSAKPPGPAVLTGVRLRIVFFGQSYLGKMFKEGDRVFFSGKLETYRNALQLANPEFEIDRDTPEDAGIADPPPLTGVVPVYSLTEGLGQRSYRKLVSRAVQEYAPLCVETIPRAARESMGLAPVTDSVRHLHFPDNPESAGTARRRFKFEELFIYQLVVLTLREEVRKMRKDRAYTKRDLEERFLKSFRGALTTAQSRSWREIREDLDRPGVMNRLLFGDVGSGKTLVAELASLHVAASGYQAAILAPTEILAEQHYSTLLRDLGPVGVKIGFLKGGMAAAKKRELKSALASGEIQIAVGTHALLQEDVTFRMPALFVIDEQHRFGVAQRAALREKGPDVDLLIMSATPIPRTLQMTLFGDLDMSFLDERPPGAPAPPRTRLLADTPSHRAIAKKLILGALAENQQVYIIYPLIEESETLDLRAATVQKDRIEKVFPKARVGLLHGRMGTEDKENVFEKFRGGQLDILVSTTVIEVGLDVPRANLIVIEHAERFGLSQLHQLRGRVGRHGRQGLCIAIHQPHPSPETLDRLRVFSEVHDGTKLAEEDLRIRGGGELFGTRQWGMPDFRFADVFRDADVLHEARRAAEELLRDDPHVLKDEHAPLRQALLDRYQGRLPLGKVS